MSQQRLFIEGPLPGLNQLIAASKRSGERIGRGGKRYNEYAKVKRIWEERVMLVVKTYRLQPFSCKVWFDFVWYELNRRRDPDNIAAAGRKIIFDALVKAEILENDGWKQIAGWSDKFKLAKGGRPGVLVVMKS